MVVYHVFQINDFKYF